METLITQALVNISVMLALVLVGVLMARLL